MLALNGIRVDGISHVLFHNISLTSPAPGLLFLVGAAGIGKSRLLHTLAQAVQGADACSPARLLLDGALPTDMRHLAQRECLPATGRLDRALLERGINPEHFAALHPGWPPETTLDEMPACERRLLAVLAALADDAPCHLLDEPTAGLDEASANRVRAAIAVRAQTSAVVMVTHNRRDCLTLGGQVALLAGGALQEYAPAEEFFARPITDAGRRYVDSGTCTLPPPTTPRHGIWWAVPGLLCGLSRPGLVADTATQFQHLVKHGVHELVCLEERVEYDVAPLRASGIAHRHMPVPDMAAPSFDQALTLCRSTAAWLHRGQAVAMHCRGGLGRTGVALAAVLVWFGDSAQDAIARVRVAQPHAIQSPAQHRFVQAFSERVQGWNTCAVSFPAPSISI